MGTMQIRNRLFAFTASLIFVALMGCQSNSFKNEDIGTAAGAIVGGLLGSRVGEGSGRYVAAAIGAVAGAYLGKKIGSWMDEQDQQDLATVGGGALDSASDGQTVSWKNPDTGLAVTATPTATKQVSRDVQVLRLKSVERHNLEIIGEPYVAQSSSNLRAGPSVKAGIVGGLRQGESFEAIGRVVGVTHKGRGWIAVGKSGGRLVGYVWEPLVVAAASPAGSTRTALTTREDIQRENRQQAKEPVDLDALDIRVADRSGGTDLDSLFEEDTITADTRCRDMDVAVEKGAEDGRSNITACKAPNGAWEII